MKKKLALNGITFYVVVIAVIMIIAMLFGNKPTNEMYYSDIISSVYEGKVELVKVSGNSIEMTFKAQGNESPVIVQKKISPYWMNQLLVDLKNAKEKMDKDKIKFQFDYDEPFNAATWINTLMFMLVIGAFGYFIFFIYRRQMSDTMSMTSFGKSRAKRYTPDKQKITFADVAGVNEEKAELQEIVDFLTAPEKYAKVGARIPRGMLLVGPPGTGKTLLAKAVAGEAGVPFFSISGSDFVEMLVGVGASRVRDLFTEAKKHSPSVIFIDEIDAVGRQRGAGMGGSHDEREQTLNQLLVEMDGFGPSQGVIVMAATNRPDILDPALLRPGRFDRQIRVMRPDLEARTAILKVHAKGKPIAADVDLREIAQITPGFTGADLANLLNEAAILCVRRNDNLITYADISEAVFKVMMGPEKKKNMMNPHEKRLTSYHEAGHAIMVRSISPTERVERISIIPAGSAGGYTAHKPFEDLNYHTVNMLKAQIMIALGGRAAEEVVFGEISTGASSDLKSCNQVARDMICKYGMSEHLTNLVFGGDDEVFLGRDYGHVKNYSTEIASIIDEEVKTLIAEGYAKCIEVLTSKRQLLDALAAALEAKEKVEGDEFEKIYLLNTTPEQRALDAKNPNVQAFSAQIAAKLANENTPETVSEPEDPNLNNQPGIEIVEGVEVSESDL